MSTRVRSVMRCVSPLRQKGGRLAWSAAAKSALPSGSQRGYSKGQRLQSADAGIKTFLTPGLDGFPAKLKQSPFDFQVHEIDLDGEVLHLSELWAPHKVQNVLSATEGEPGALAERRGHLHFRLYKEGLDTMDAVGRISRCIRRSRKSFRFAGTKDRCAVTVQRVSCARLTAPELLRAMLHEDWDPRIRVSDIEEKVNDLELGDLGGNVFSIVLRGLPGAACTLGGQEVVDRCFLALRERGFLNYFGLQRFGSQRIHSFHVGAALLAGQLGNAVRLILGDGSSVALPSAAMGAAEVASKPWASVELVATMAAQEHFAETGDAARALELMPRTCDGQSLQFERSLLGSLGEGLDFEAALSRLPRQALMLYVKAAQSLLFNHVLSQRIQCWGPEPVAGDLVLALEPPQSRTTRPEERVRAPRPLPSVRVLQTGETPETRLTQVVLPLPGGQVIYPDGLQEVYEAASMELLGLPLEAFHRKLPLSLPLAGTYRQVAVVPDNLHWRILPPEEAVETARLQRGRLMLTDVDRLEGLAEGVTRSTCKKKQGGADGTARQRCLSSLRPPSGDKGGEASTGSVVLSCQLPPSAYLTMAIREVTRQEDSWFGRR